MCDEQLKQIDVPVWGFYGGNDFRITGQVPEVKEKLAELDKTYKPEIYKGAGHGFMRAGEAPDAEAANKQARQQAWERWLSILKSLEQK